MKKLQLVSALLLISAMVLTGMCAGSRTDDRSAGNCPDAGFSGGCPYDRCRPSRDAKEGGDGAARREDRRGLQPVHL